MKRAYGLKFLGAPPRAKVSELRGSVGLPQPLLAGPAQVSVDLRGRMPPVYDQGVLGSCTANALCAAMQYYDAKLQGSRLFLYYNERAREGTTDRDAGATVADGIKCLQTQGLCQEALWPYNPRNFAQRPPALCYARALAHEALAPTYVPGSQLKAALNAGHPVTVGILVYASFESDAVARTGDVPMPAPGEPLLGGHAVLLCGYNDEAQRWLLRNSWGPGWGAKGYFYLPYAYLLSPRLCGEAWCFPNITNPTTA
jgi:C1A family cysteine protease